MTPKRVAAMLTYQMAACKLIFVPLRSPRWDVSPPKLHEVNCKM